MIYEDLPFAGETKIGGVIEKSMVIVGRLTPEKIQDLSDLLDVDFDTWFSWKELNALASASGAIDSESSHVIYKVLGNDPQDFNKESLAVKIVVSRIMLNVYKEIKERTKEGV